MVDHNRIIRKRKSTAACGKETKARKAHHDINQPPDDSDAQENVHDNMDSTATDAAENGSHSDKMKELIQAEKLSSIGPLNQLDSGDGPPDDVRPAPKFQFRQRIFAKDADTGLLYDGVIRRAAFGVQNQRQIKLTSSLSENELKALLEQEMEPTWWYYIHYSGWNVKWDRWVEESQLYEVTESNKAFAKLLQDEVKNIKAEVRSKGLGKSAASRVALLLEPRIAMMEREHRLAERRNELLAQGKIMGQAEEDDLLSQSIKPRRKWSKANIEKEIALRQRDLQGKRSQSSAELLVLPFALKKILVEEWEVITQSNMLASLPASISVRQALNMYLESKLKITHASDSEEGQDSKLTWEGGEWHEMVEGICLFFDQALPNRLLYQTEQIQFEFLRQEMNTKCWSDVCGCEYLLRLFLRLPAVLVGETSESESKSILAKLNDLVRFLLKHQSMIFAQSYRRWTAIEQLRRDQLSR